MDYSDDEGNSTTVKTAVTYAPAHTTREFQPCAVSVFRGLKSCLTGERDQDTRYADLSKLVQHTEPTHSKIESPNRQSNHNMGPAWLVQNSPTTAAVGEAVDGVAARLCPNQQDIFNCDETAIMYNKERT